MKVYEVNKRNIIITRSDALTLMRTCMLDRDEIASPGEEVTIKNVYYAKAKKMSEYLHIMRVINGDEIITVVNGDSEALIKAYTNPGQDQFINDEHDGFVVDSNEKLIVPGEVLSIKDTGSLSISLPPKTEQTSEIEQDIATDTAPAEEEAVEEVEEPAVEEPVVEEATEEIVEEEEADDVPVEDVEENELPEDEDEVAVEAESSDRPVEFNHQYHKKRKKKR